MILCLTTALVGDKNTPIPARVCSGVLARESDCPESMTTSRPAQPAAMTNDLAKCKHPRVRVVAREEDAEFVECLECGEVFESSEFKDMEIEESKLEEAE
jgi:hypothetical protein